MRSRMWVMCSELMSFLPSSLWGSQPTIPNPRQTHGLSISEDQNQVCPHQHALFHANKSSAWTHALWLKTSAPKGSQAGAGDTLLNTQLQYKVGHMAGWERRRNVQDLGEVKRDFSEELTDQLILEEQTQLAGREAGGLCGGERWSYEHRTKRRTA